MNSYWFSPIRCPIQRSAPFESCAFASAPCSRRTWTSSTCPHERPTPMGTVIPRFRIRAVFEKNPSNLHKCPRRDDTCNGVPSLSKPRVSRPVSARRTGTLRCRSCHRRRHNARVLPWPVTGVRIARIESMNGVLGRIILIAMALDGGTRQSATHRIGKAKYCIKRIFKEKLWDRTKLGT